MTDEQKARLNTLRAKHRKPAPEDDETAVQWTEIDGIYAIGPGEPTTELVCYYAADYSERLHGHLEPTGEAS